MPGRPSGVGIIERECDARRLSGKRLPANLIELCRRWHGFFEDAVTTWGNPATGQSHYILDLDWRQTFGMGYRAVKIEYGRAPVDNVFLARLAELLADLTGEPMVMAHLHL